MENDGYLHKELTGAVLKIFYEVYNELGYGFLERVYQNALYYELKKHSFAVEAQKRIKVNYKEIEVGDYFADIIVNNCLILELKSAESISKERHEQLINYLKSTDCEVGLLLNFGKNPNSSEKYSKITENKSASSAFP